MKYSINTNGTLSEAPFTQSTTRENGLNNSTVNMTHDSRMNDRANDELSDDGRTSNSGE